MSKDKINKVMTTHEAVSRFIKNGQTIICGNYTEGLPFSLLFEIIRQKKKNLTYYSQSGSFDAEFMAASGCVDKICSAFVAKWGGRTAGSMVERYQRAKQIEVEDYTNFTYAARLAAGAYGYSFMPVLPAIMVSDVFKVRGFMGNHKFSIMTCPFTGRKIPVVPAINPDVSVLHVQRADRHGNAQHWGGLGSTIHACLASKTIIVTCEELVDYDVVKSSPHHTIVPGFRVSAVIEEPYGCHPSELPGYRNFDIAMLQLMIKNICSEGGLKSMFDEWVYNLPDRASYMQHYVQVFGQDSLNRYRARSYYSAPANYGIAFDSGWDSNGSALTLGVNMEELEKLIAEKGDIVCVD